jgi:hypothetical protein
MDEMNETDEMDVRAIAAGRPDAAFGAAYPKLARVLACLCDEPDAAKRESTIGFVERLVALAAQVDRDKATKEAGIAIFGLCAPADATAKLASALATASDSYCDEQIALLARSFDERGGAPREAPRTAR